MTTLMTPTAATARRSGPMSRCARWCSAEIKGVDRDQFIGGELSFEDWLAESFNTGIYRKVDEAK